MQVLLKLGVVIALAMVVAGQAGALHPAGDSLAVLQVPALVAGLLAGLLAGVLGGARAWPGAVAMMVLAVLLMLRVADWVWPGDGPVGEVALYQKNLRFDGIDPAAFVAEIEETAPDMITLQEVSTRNAALVGKLAARYQTRHTCGFTGVGGTAVLSHFPAVAGRAFCLPGMAAMKLEGPQGAFWLVALHLHWPWPYGQADQSAALLERLAQLDAPVVIGGDFNMVPWSYRLRAFQRASGSRLAWPIRASFHTSGVPLPIDHVLAPCGGRREMRPALGSDHLGLLVRLSTGADCAR